LATLFSETTLAWLAVTFCLIVLAVSAVSPSTVTFFLKGNILRLAATASSKRLPRALGVQSDFLMFFGKCQLSCLGDSFLDNAFFENSRRAHPYLMERPIPRLRLASESIS